MLGKRREYRFCKSAPDSPIGLAYRATGVLTANRGRLSISLQSIWEARS